MVLHVRNAVFKFVLLNRLVTLCTSVLWYVNVIQFFLCVCMGVFFVPCALTILFLKLRIICNVKPLFLAMVQVVFHSCCLACSVIGVDNILFMLKLYATSLCCNGWLDVKCMVVSLWVFYKFLVGDCCCFIVGQTGRSIEIRHREHVRYIKTNNPLSSYALHIINNRHEYGNPEHTIKLLQTWGKGKIMNCWD